METTNKNTESFHRLTITTYTVADHARPYGLTVQRTKNQRFPHGGMFETETERNESIQRYKDKETQVMQGIKEKAAARKLEADKTAEIAKENLKPGMIFYTSWGYDQTNYDFLVILSISKSGKTCKCRMTERLDVDHSGQSDVQFPVNCPYGDEFKMNISSDTAGDIFYLRGSYPFCNDGSIKNKRIDTFSQHVGDRTYHQTDAWSGH